MNWSVMIVYKKGDKIKVATVLDGEKIITVMSVSKDAVITWLLCDDNNEYDESKVEKVD